MLTRLPWMQVYANLVGLALLFGVVLGPAPNWWLVFLPYSASAALQLREAPHLYHDRGCEAYSLQLWAEILHGPHAAKWFTALADEAVTPEGYVFGLVGLQATDSAGFVRRITRLSPKRLGDRVTFMEWPGLSVVTIRTILPDILSGSLRRGWSGPRGPWCD